MNVLEHKDGAKIIWDSGTIEVGDRGIVIACDNRTVNWAQSLRKHFDDLDDAGYSTDINVGFEHVSLSDLDTFTSNDTTGKRTCSHCGQWQEAFTECQYCGAPV